MTGTDERTAPELGAGDRVGDTVLSPAACSGRGRSAAVGGTTAFLNRIATAVPPYDVHHVFVDFVNSQLRGDNRKSALFHRMVDRGAIDRRYSCLEPATDPAATTIDAEGIFLPGRFPDTAGRMRLFERHAPVLAAQAVDRLQLGEDAARVSHLIVTTCTGFSAPGLDLEIVERCGLNPSVERTIVGFMGCYAAMNALKLGRHIVRSEPSAKVLIVNLELCTLHLKESQDLEELLSYLIFADGCSASLVSAEAEGVALDSFQAVLAPDTRSLITWNVGASGFDMVLSGKVPASIHDTLSRGRETILEGAMASDIDLWAVHPGGRTVLDAVERALELGPSALAASRDILRRFGNMSSATVMFVMGELMRAPARAQRGCAMAFGPGLVAETMLFHTGH